MDFTPNAPLFRDPIYDGAADPTVIYNKKDDAWYMFYTNRRAFGPNTGVSYCHGTDIGIAVSKDGWKTWRYRGIAQGLEFERGRNTFWAPEIIYANGIYHAYVSYVPGVPTNWNESRSILHYTSDDLWQWQFESKLELSSDRVIDACLYEISPGKWKMWYKDEVNGSHTYSAVSDNLYDWKVLGAEITSRGHEGPNVFILDGQIYMVVDVWEGLQVYTSNDFTNWTAENIILSEAGNRQDDGANGRHADVVVCGERAYIFYFTHPEVSLEMSRQRGFTWEYNHRRTSIQIAELKRENGILVCERNDVQVRNI